METVVLLSKLNTKQHIEVELNLDELDLTAAESKATYDEIKAYVLDVNNGELVPSARSNCTTLPKQEYRLAGWLYRSATALCQRCEPLFR